MSETTQPVGYARLEDTELGQNLKVAAQAAEDARAQVEGINNGLPARVEQEVTQRAPGIITEQAPAIVSAELAGQVAPIVEATEAARVAAQASEASAAAAVTVAANMTPGQAAALIAQQAVRRILPRGPRALQDAVVASNRKMVLYTGSTGGLIGDVTIPGLDATLTALDSFRVDQLATSRIMVRGTKGLRGGSIMDRRLISYIDTAGDLRTPADKTATDAATSDQRILVRGAGGAYAGYVASRRWVLRISEDGKVSVDGQEAAASATTTPVVSTSDDWFASGLLEQAVAHEVTVDGRGAIELHTADGVSTIATAGRDWIAPRVTSDNAVVALSDATRGVMEPHVAFPSGERLSFKGMLLSTAVTGQSLGLGSRGFITDAQGVVLWGEVFSKEPSRYAETVLGFAIGPRLLPRVEDGVEVNSPATTAEQMGGLVPLVEKHNAEVSGSVTGETVLSGWSVGWGERTTRRLHWPIRTLAWSSAVGGSRYISLNRGKPAYVSNLNAVAHAHSLAGAEGWAHRFLSMKLMHGEAEVDTPAETYADYLAEWQAHYDEDIRAITGQSEPVPLLVSQMSHFMSSTRQIPGAMMAAHETNPMVVVVGPKYQFAYYDGVHMLAKGYYYTGRYFERADWYWLAYGTKWQPLKCTSITRAGNVTTLGFNNSLDGGRSVAGPVGRLAFDPVRSFAAENHGFRISDGTAITAVALGANGTSVELTHTAASPGAMVTYAMGDEYATQCGTLRDTDQRDTCAFDGDHLFNWCVTFERAIPA